MGAHVGALLAAPVLVLLTCADLFVSPLGLVDPPALSPVYATLAATPDGVVAQFPFYDKRPDVHLHTQHMRSSTSHGRRLVNGYRDNIPLDFREMVTTIAEFPDPGSIALLRKLGMRYVVVHLDLYGDAAGTMGRLLRPWAEYLRPLKTAGPVTLYEIVRFPPARYRL